MKIVSLLPSATEIVFALGLGEQLRGVSFECDYPEPARSVPDRVGNGAAHRRLAQRAGDRRRGQRPRGGGGVHLHARRRPDPGHRSRPDPGAGPVPGLRRAVGRGGGGARRHRVPRAGGLARPGPARRGDRLHRDGGCRDGHRRASGRADGGPARPGGGGAATGPRTRPAPGARPGMVRTRPSTPGTGSPTRWRRRAACRSSPPPAPGRAGSPGRRSRRAQVDVTVFMPCGFDLAGAVAQAPALLARPEAAGLGRIVAVDANAYFSRPGPRVVDGVELLERTCCTARPGRYCPGAQVLRGPEPP